MYYGLTKSTELYQQSDLLVVGFVDEFSSNDLPLTNKQLFQLTNLSKHLKKKNQYRCFYTEEDQTIITINCGKSSEFDLAALKKILKTIFELEEVKQSQTIHLCMPSIEAISVDEMAQHLTVQTDYFLYKFNHFKTQDEEEFSHCDQTVRFYLPNCEESVIDKASALCHGIRLARNLGNYPANICTPGFIADQAQEMTKQFSQIQCRIMGKQEMKEIGMNLLLSVAQGSSQEPKLIELKYQNGGDKAPIVLVGKGITFDSGGYSLKPGNAMSEMKYDMCGAASVIGLIQAIAEAELPVNVIGVIATTENLVSGEATKPGDVFTSMSGQTVEVINTDAEGRLILADTLTYVEQFEPAFVIDIATLTGAMVVALGSVYTGIFSPDDDLAHDIIQASEQSQDLCWRIPLHQDYADILSSPVADLANASWDRSAGSITAAWFLSNFTKKYRWAHCDIAGTAWVPGKKRNATGRPIHMLFKLIENQAKQ